MSIAWLPPVSGSQDYKHGKDRVGRALRRFSPRFIAMLIVSTSALYFVGSAFEMLEFGVLYAFMYAFTPAGTFVLGGAFACAIMSISHYRFARAHKPSTVQTI